MPLLTAVVAPERGMAMIIAATLGIILLWLVVRQAAQAYRSALLLIACTCLPAAVLLLPLAIDGGLHDFWISSIVAATYYVGVSVWNKMESSGIWPAQLRALRYILSGNIIGGYVATLASAASLAFAVLPIREIVRSALARRMLSKHPDAVRIAIVFVVLLASVCAVIVPARPFPHYALLFLWPLTLLAGLAWSLASSWPATGEGGRWHPAKVVGSLSILYIGGLALQEAKLDYDPEVTGTESVFGRTALGKPGRRPRASAGMGLDAPVVCLVSMDARDARYGNPIPNLANTCPTLFPRPHDGRFTERSARLHHRCRGAGQFRLHRSRKRRLRKLS